MHLIIIGIFEVILDSVEIYELHVIVFINANSFPIRTYLNLKKVINWVNLTVERNLPSFISRGKGGRTRTATLKFSVMAS